MGIRIFWQRMRDSNPRKRSQSPVCYRYTNPLFSWHEATWWRQQDSNLWPHACEASSRLRLNVSTRSNQPKHLIINDFSRWQPIRTAWWFQNWTTCLIPRALYIINCSRNKTFYVNDTTAHPAYKNGQLNITELSRVCDLSRTTIYKYISLLEA